MGFLRTCMSEEDRTDQFATATLGLIGDFGETYKKQVRDVLLEEWVVNAIAYGRQRGASKQARRNATYAQKVGPSFLSSLLGDTDK
jgi:importin subunit beta-1